MQELEERSLIRLFENEIFRDPLGKLESGEVENSSLVLTDEQSSALKKIVSSLGSQPLSFLLHGVTSSGKTEIYLRAVEEAIKNGKQAIVLVPEIALTPQLVRRFLARFPGQVGLVHSKLSEGERYDTWRRARTGKLKCHHRRALGIIFPVAGYRLDRGGWNVMTLPDYQSEAPFYNAVAFAQEYARLCGAACILGSATPTVEQRFQATNHQIQKLDLRYRVTEFALPPVHIVDMREELKQGSRGIFAP